MASKDLISLPEVETKPRQAKDKGFLQGAQVERKRFLIFAGVMLLAFLWIFWRTASLQLDRSESHGIALSKGTGGAMHMKAKRGDILDRKGRPLAYSVESDSLYLAYTGLPDEELNRLLLDLSEAFETHDVPLLSDLTLYFDLAARDRLEGAGSFVFRQDMDRIARWQQHPDLFALLPLQEGKGSQGRVKTDPQAFYDYLLYDAFAIERRDVQGSLRYSAEEAWKIMRLRYQLMLENWTFMQGEPVRLAREIPAALKAEIQEQSLRYQGVVISQESTRRYSDDARYFAHSLGYVGPISAESYERLKPFGYQINDQVGQAGVEASAERYLHGKNGRRPFGTWLLEQGQRRFEAGREGRLPEPGASVRLTLDTHVQKVLYASLYDTIAYVREHELGHASSAAAVMLDLKKGQILAMGSVPSFEPSDFLQASHDELAAKRVQDALEDQRLRPLQNRCISEIYAPGSTYKAVSAAAAIMEEVITPEQNSYLCQGKEEIGFKTWVCFGEPIHGHGLITLEEALVHSCNLYFFKMALDTGIADLTHWAQRFGLGEYTGVDLPGEVKGIRPSPALKALTRKMAQDQEWYPADTCQTAIGQFDNAYTPLQLARAIGAIASNRLLSPHVIAEIRSPDGRLLREEELSTQDAGLNETALSMIKEGMRNLKNYGNSHHTQRNFAQYPIDVSAKTGTAEVGTDDLTTNAVFVCFGPTEDPEFAIACIVEQGGKGDVSSNIARDLIDAYYGFEPRPQITSLLEEMEKRPLVFDFDPPPKEREGD